MNCEAFRASLGDLIDGSLPEAERQALEAHAATCDACRAVLDDLRRIKSVAASLDAPPPRDIVWTRIAASLSNEPEFAKGAERPRVTPIAAHRPRSARLPKYWLPAAAALIAAVALSLWMLRRPSPGEITAGNQPAPADSSASDQRQLVDSVEAELALAAEHYEKAIAGLEHAANADESPLDPQVMATLKANLDVIDRAITESRTAVRAQPESEVARESLFEAFRRKMSLLQDTIALMNEVRKGDPAGAARAAEGLNKS